MTLAQPQVLPGHLAASPSPQAVLATSTATVSAASATPPSLITMAASLPGQIPGAAPGKDCILLTLYSIDTHFDALTTDIF